MRNSPLIAVAALIVVIGLATYFLLDHRLWQAYLIGGCVAALVLLYIFSPQIRWWWYLRYPQPLHPKMRIVLEKTMPYFSNLLPELRARFEQRMSLYMLSKSYEAKVIEIIPEDLKGMIAANAIKLSLGLEEFLSPNFETIVFYPNRFPSPAIQDFHASEAFEDGDFGGMIFALDHIMLGLQDEKHYNVVMHELVNVLWLQNGWSDQEFVTFATPQNVHSLAKIREISTPQIKKILGKPKINFNAVIIEHFFAKPEAFKSSLPELYNAIAKKLNQDPTNESNPVLIDAFIKMNKSARKSAGRRRRKRLNF